MIDQWNTGKDELGEKFELVKPVENEFADFDLFKRFMFMCFDHVGFFLFADHKLPRILGKKAGFLDKYVSIKKMFMNLLSLIILIVVLVSQFGKWGWKKSHTTDLSIGSHYKMNISQEFPLIGFVYFDTNEIL